MRLKIFVLLIFTGFAGVLAKAQIHLQNPSFENGHYDCSPSNILEWNTCDVGVANCIIDTISYAKPDSAVDGRFVGEVTADNNFLGSFSQYSLCRFKAGKKHEFTVYLASYMPDNNPIDFPRFTRGKIEIWLGNDTCHWQQQIFLSPLLDSFWVKYSISFIPDSDYSYFFFRGHPPTTSPVLSTLMIDALSPIYVTNSHQVHTYQQDTTLPIGNSICVNLNAYTDAAYDSVWWEQTGAGIISTQLNAGTWCVDSNTTFVVHITGTDSTCAGRMPASDTVKVSFFNPNAVHEVTQTSIKIYPNPSSKQLGFFISTNVSGKAHLYNTLGQLITSINVITGTNQLSSNTLQSGIYHVVFELDNGEVITNRVILQ